MCFLEAVRDIWFLSGFMLLKELLELVGCRYNKRVEVVGNEAE